MLLLKVRYLALISSFLVILPTGLGAMRQKGLVSQVVGFLFGEPKKSNKKVLPDIVHTHEGSELALIKKLEGAIADGADIDGTNEIGWSALHLAAAYGYVWVVKLLVQKGANIDLKNSDGDTALRIAIDEWYPDIVIFLLKSERYGPRYFDLGADSTLEEIAYLVAKGADINKTSDNGYTPLLLLASHRADKNGKCVAFLLKHGADIYDADKFGNTALHVAAMYDNLEGARVLIKNGANIDEKNRAGETALHCAARCGSLRVVKLLIEKGAQVNERTLTGETPLHYAVHQVSFSDFYDKGIWHDKGICMVPYSRVYAKPQKIQPRNLAISMFLIENGAFFQGKNKKGLTAFDMAKNETRKDKLRYLAFIADFYQVVHNQMLFKDFAKQYDTNDTRVALPPDIFCTSKSDFSNLLTFFPEYKKIPCSVSALQLYDAVRFALVGGYSKFIRAFYKWDRQKLRVIMGYPRSYLQFCNQGIEFEGDLLCLANDVTRVPFPMAIEKKTGGFYGYLLGLAMLTNSFLLAQDILTKSPALWDLVRDRKTFELLWKKTDQKLFRGPVVNLWKTRQMLKAMIIPHDTVDCVLKFVPVSHYGAKTRKNCKMPNDVVF